MGHGLKSSMKKKCEMFKEIKEMWKMVLSSQFGLLRHLKDKSVTKLWPEFIKRYIDRWKIDRWIDKS